MHREAVPRDFPLPHGVEIKPDYYIINIFPCYFINTCSKLLPNKYMELYRTKAIARVPRSGSYFLYNYFTNTHPLISNISKEKIIKYKFSMFLINF